MRQQDLHLIDQNKDKFTIDYDTYFQKQVIKPLVEFQVDRNLEVIGQYKSRYPHFYKQTAPAQVKCPRCGRGHSRLGLAQKCISKVDKQDKQLLRQSINYLKQFS